MGSPPPLTGGDRRHLQNMRDYLVDAEASLDCLVVRDQSLEPMRDVVIAMLLDIGRRLRRPTIAEVHDGGTE